MSVASLLSRIDPATAARVLFGHDHWSVPEAVIRSVFTPYSRTAVKGCHSSGKTFAAGDIVPLALLYGADVVTTAPTGTQVAGQLWRNIHLAIKDSLIPFEQWGTVNQVEIRLPSGERAFGRSTNQGVRFHGEHARAGRPLIVIVDEAPGVIGSVMNAIEGMRAGGDVRVLLMGNPLEPSGYFYDAFEPPLGVRSPWTCFTIGAFDTPNLEGLTIDDVLAMTDAELDDNPRPYLITRRYVREKYEEWGADDWQYMGRVLGLFPEETIESLFRKDMLDQAVARQPAPFGDGPLRAAIDVAGPGEAETVLTIARGGDILFAKGYGGSDPRDDIEDELDLWVPRGLSEIRVDSVGIGWYFYREFVDEYSQHDVRVRPINVGEASRVVERVGKIIKRKYDNKKAEYYWHLRTLLANGQVSGLPPRAAAQLRPIKYRHPSGIIKVESKGDLAARGIASPDWAESVMLLFAPDDPLDQFAGVFGKQGHLHALPSDDGRPHGWEGPWTLGVQSAAGGRR